MLRETLQTYIQHGMSVDATAAALVVHRNTVRYRLARAEGFLPAPIVDQHVRLAFALQYAAWFDVGEPDQPSSTREAILETPRGVRSSAPSHAVKRDS